MYLTTEIRETITQGPSGGGKLHRQKKEYEMKEFPWSKETDMEREKRGERGFLPLHRYGEMDAAVGFLYVPEATLSVRRWTLPRNDRHIGIHAKDRARKAIY